MLFKFKHMQKIVGGFFLLTCIIIVVLLVMVARGQRWFQHYATYSCVFDSGGGLNTGSSVMIQGLDAGRIESISLDSDNRVRIDLRIFSQYANRIREESLAKLVSPIVGSSRLEIVLGSGDSPLIVEGGQIPTEAVSGGELDALIERTTQLVKGLQDPGGDLMQSLSNIRRGTGDLAAALSKKDGTLRMLIERRELYDELTSASAHLDHLLSAIDDRTPEIQDAIVEARRGLEEVNKVVLAMQKSIFLRGNMERYLKEDPTLTSEGRAR